MAKFYIMKNLLSIILILIAMGCTQQETFTYPETAKGHVVDDYHGTKVPDPYRWLEDDMSDETAAWVKAQNELTFSYLETIPFRDALKERMTEIWNYPKMGTPFKEGNLISIVTIRACRTRVFSILGRAWRTRVKYFWIPMAFQMMEPWPWPV